MSTWTMVRAVTAAQCTEAPHRWIVASRERVASPDLPLDTSARVCTLSVGLRGWMSSPPNVHLRGLYLRRPPPHGPHGPRRWAAPFHPTEADGAPPPRQRHDRRRAQAQAHVPPLQRRGDRRAGPPRGDRALPALRRRGSPSREALRRRARTGIRVAVRPRRGSRGAELLSRSRVATPRDPRAAAPNEGHGTSVAPRGPAREREKGATPRCAN